MKEKLKDSLKTIKIKRRSLKPIIRATIFTLKRDKEFYKKIAESNLEKFISKIKEELLEPHKNITNYEKLRKLILDEDSPLDKLVFIEIKLSDLHDILGEFKDEIDIYRKIFDLNSRILNLEK